MFIELQKTLIKLENHLSSIVEQSSYPSEALRPALGAMFHVVREAMKTHRLQHARSAVAECREVVHDERDRSLRDLLLDGLGRIESLLSEFESRIGDLQSRHGEAE